MTTLFKITWPTGLVTREYSETSTPETYAMERWGSDYKQVFEGFGVTLEVITDPVADKAATIAEAKARS